MDPTASHPLLTQAPNCLACGSQTNRHVTHWDNANGNAYRPYFKCKTSACKKFACFGDMRGIHANNPACDCGLPSRFQLGMKDETFPGALHWRCAVGGCHYFQRYCDPEGVVPCFPRRRYEADQMIKIGL